MSLCQPHRCIGRWSISCLIDIPLWRSYHEKGDCREYLPKAETVKYIRTNVRPVLSNKLITKLFNVRTVLPVTVFSDQPSAPLNVSSSSGPCSPAGPIRHGLRDA